MSKEDEEYAAQRKETDERIQAIRKIDHSFDMAYKLGTLQAKAKWAVKYMRMGSETCKNPHIRAMLRKEAAELRKFLVEECQMDIPFDARFDI